MSKVISVLEKMASDAAMNSEDAIAELVSTSDINDGQQQAIKANDSLRMLECTTDLPNIQSVFLIPAEDEEPAKEGEEEESTDTTSSLANVANF